MKKLLILSIMVVAFFATGTAHTIDDVFNAFTKDKNAELVNLPNLEDVIQRKINDDKDDEVIAASRKIESVRMLKVDKATVEQKQRARKIATEGINGMEELLTVNENGEDVTIFVAMNGEKIVQMLIFAIDTDDLAIVSLTGDLEMNDIKKIGLFN